MRIYKKKRDVKHFFEKMELLHKIKNKPRQTHKKDEKVKQCRQRNTPIFKQFFYFQPTQIPSQEGILLSPPNPQNTQKRRKNLTAKPAKKIRASSES
ncbi:MAG TPA: hypothetical protein ENH49_04520 [Candidatus Marinimicrobia bacterium]|nr:hypothetical protein [Candidatus Neomarinimicrobiota bacterium]